MHLHFTCTRDDFLQSMQHKYKVNQIKPVQQQTPRRLQLSDKKLKNLIHRSGFVPHTHTLPELTKKHRKLRRTRSKTNGTSERTSQLLFCQLYNALLQSLISNEMPEEELLCNSFFFAIVGMEKISLPHIF